MTDVVQHSGANVVMISIALVAFIGFLDTFGGVVRNSLRRLLKRDRDSEGGDA